MAMEAAQGEAQEAFRKMEKANDAAAHLTEALNVKKPGPDAADPLAPPPVPEASVQAATAAGVAPGTAAQPRFRSMTSA